MRPFFRWSKLPKNRRFTYHPRYWDPDKEALQERLKKYSDESGDPDAVELSKSRIASNFKARRGGGHMKSGKTGNFRLVLILICLIALTYFFLNTYAHKIVNWIE